MRIDRSGGSEADAEGTEGKSVQERPPPLRDRPGTPGNPSRLESLRIARETALARQSQSSGKESGKQKSDIRQREERGDSTAASLRADAEENDQIGTEFTQETLDGEEAGSAAAPEADEGAGEISVVESAEDDESTTKGEAGMSAESVAVDGENSKRASTVERGLGTLDETEKSFDPAERRIADLLASEGCKVKALRESEDPGVRTPDAIVDDRLTEFKSLKEGAGSNTVKNALNSAKGQAEDAIVDARGSGLEEETARSGLDRFLRINPERMNSVRIIGDGYNIQWPGE